MLLHNRAVHNCRQRRSLIHHDGMRHRHVSSCSVVHSLVFRRQTFRQVLDQRPRPIHIQNLQAITDAEDRFAHVVGILKQQFVDRVTASVVEVVAASAALPTGLKLGKKTAKATGKVIRKRAKTIKKDAKKTVVVAAPSKARAKAKPKPKSKPKAKK